MRRIDDQHGFTLFEVLVVMIIIGILAAIGYAVFLGQRTKADDARAKDAATALSIDVESCLADRDTFTACDDQAAIDDSSLDYDGSVTVSSSCTTDPTGMSDAYDDPRAEKVAVVAASDTCYIAEALSKSGHLFWVLRHVDASAQRGCVPPGQGGCVSSSDPSVGTWNH